MRNLWIALTMISSLVLSVSHAAPPDGLGGGRGQGGGGHGMGPAGHAGGTRQAPAAIFPAETGIPPGLAGKEVPGLAQQGKVPSGWSHGKAWWKTPGAAPHPLTLKQIRTMTVEEANEALSRLRTLTTPTPRQKQDIARLERKLKQKF